LLGREGSVVDAVGVFTIELVLSSIDLADSNKGVRNTVSTTIIDFSAANTVSCAVFRELEARDIISKESAALAFTKEVRLSIAVIRDVPASSFKETEGDFRDLGSDDTTSGHDFPLIESSFNVSTSISFHEKTGNSGASVKVSESFSQGRKVKDGLVYTAEGDSLDMVLE